MRIRWLIQAVNDLEDIHGYICNINPSAAKKEIKKILNTIAHLRKNPNIGRIGRVKETREFVIPKSSFITVYRLKNDTVEILRILHSARKWPKRF